MTREVLPRLKGETIAAGFCRFDKVPCAECGKEVMRGTRVASIGLAYPTRAGSSLR